MSKLFPMFKKKGKGKDEDVSEEEPKRKGKTERVKEALLSPRGLSSSPSKASKHRKKGKAAKEKRVLNGKVNNGSTSHSPEEAEVQMVEDFYVDDDGIVKVGPLEDQHSFVEDQRSFVEDQHSFVEDQHSFVDEVMSSVEESFSLEQEKSLNPIDRDEDIDVFGKNEHEGKDREISPMPRDEMESSFHKPGDLSSDRSSQNSDESVAVAEPEESITSSVYSQNSEENDSVRDQIEQSNIDQEMVSTNSAEDLKASREILSELSEIEASKESHEVENMKPLEENNVEEEETEKAESSASHLETSKVVEEVITTDEKRLSEPSLEGEVESEICSSEDTEKDKIMDATEELQSESVEKSEKQVSEPTASSQDSDDDFDSAQEDWDEDEDDGVKNVSLKPNLPPSQDQLNEAKNEILVDNDNASASGSIGNRHSSVYEDAKALLQDPSHLGESSDDKIPAVFEESRKPRRISGSEKLVRKLSNISAASSDAFNEELDDLLDEELDRLSEEEETGALGQDGEVAEGVEAGAASGVPVELTVHNPVVPSDQVDAEPTDNEKPESDKDVEKNNEVDSAHSSPSVDSSQSPRDDSKVKLTNNDTKESSTSGSHLSAPDENPDQVKDSGYYSLPVSPNPVVRASSESEREVKGADDSFGDSEEEGMITPPSEVSTLEDKTENPKELVALIEDEADNAMVVQPNVSHEVSNQSDKCDHKVLTDASMEKSSELKPKSQTPKQGAKLKVIIPKSGEKPRDKVITSPKCGSPTKLRHKTPLKDTDVAFSPDPVGERFLKEAVASSHEEAEARLAQRRAARAEARELRLRELEKQQHDQENDEEKQFGTSNFAEPSPRATVAARTSVGRTAALNSTGQYSRRSSEDSTTDEAALPANVREMRAELKELDEKFRKAMITNAQLDNEKSTLTYEVELIKDKYTELEETHTQLNKEHRRKCTEYEQLRKVSTKLQEEVKILRGMLQERDQLIQEYGLVVIGEEEENGEVPPEPDEFADMDDLTPRKIAVKKVLLSQEAAELLGKGSAKGSLDIRLKRFGEDKNDLEDQVRRLKLELEEERNTNRRRENGLDYEKAKEQSKTLNEYKFRVQKAEAEVLTLQANVARLDALQTRYKTQSEELEKSEEDLKAERRKLQRELRDEAQKYDDLETTKNYLQRQYDKLKHDRTGRH